MHCHKRDLTPLTLIYGFLEALPLDEAMLRPRHLD